MRRVFRRHLSPRSVRELKRKQVVVDTKQASGTLRVEVEWKRARQNKPLEEAVAILKVMAGDRERCMYCGDSHGTDIEHFWPKAHYPDRMFHWPNMLLCCAECGRIKGAKFPLIDDLPALIDLSIDDPWEFLDFDPATGNIVARYDPNTQEFTPKGRATVQVLELDRREAMSKGYQRTFRRLKQHVEQALEQLSLEAAALIHELKAEDDHGLLGWCLEGLGNQVAPFADLQARHPAVWQECLQVYRQH